MTIIYHIKSMFMSDSAKQVLKQQLHWQSVQGKIVKTKALKG